MARQWRKTATGGEALHLGEHPVAYVAQADSETGGWSAWPMLCTGVDGIFPSSHAESREAAKAYATRQVDLWLLRAELRET